MAVCMSLPYRTCASVQLYPVVCTAARRPGQISSESGAAKAQDRDRDQDQGQDQGLQGASPIAPYGSIRGRVNTVHPGA